MKTVKVLLVVLLLLSVGLGAVLLLIPADDLHEVDILLSKADDAYESGSFHSMKLSLQRAIKKARGQKIWLRIAKRTFLYGKSQRDFSLFYDTTRRATERLPGNETLWALHVIAAMRMEKWDEAQTAAEYLQSPDYRLIKAEALLSSEVTATINTEKISPMEAVQQQLNEHRDPRDFENVAESLGDFRLFMDAAYLWMLRGEIELAKTDMMRVPRGQRNHEAAGYIAMDAGLDDIALRELEAAFENSRRQGAPRWDISLIIADAYRNERQWDQAEELYRNALDAVPRIDEKPYRALAYIYRSTGRIEKIIPLLQKGIEVFSQNNEWSRARPLYLSLADYYLQKGDVVLARKSIEEYSRYNPDDPEALLFLFDKIGSTELSSAQRESRLWDLFNEHETNTYLAQYLAWFLMGKGDYPGVYLLLDRHGSRFEIKPEWIRYYRAVTQVLEGRYQGALENFNSDYEETGRWASRYNSALVLAYLDQDREALTYLDEALSRIQVELPDTISRNIWVSQIYADRAKILFGINQVEKSLRVAQEAIELNPENTKAQSIIRIIETNAKKNPGETIDQNKE